MGFEISASQSRRNSAYKREEIHVTTNSSMTPVGKPADDCEPPRRRTSFQRESFSGEYLRRLIEGDPDTEDHFCRYFSDLLGIKLRARFRDAALIDDLRQEILLRVFTAIKRSSSLRSPESLGGFVNSVCNNLLIEMYRRKASSRTVELGDHDIVDGRGSAEMELVTEERRREVRRVLNELPERDRELLRLVFCENVGREAICLAYHVEREYLRVLVHRAKRRFRDLALRRAGRKRLA
jgi:RNA polymerase sigma-70 factor (ECF subfamily)